MRSARADAIRGFLGAAGWAGAAPAPLAGDASRRRYLRLAAPGGATAVLMDAPPHPETRTRAFVALSGWLRARGFSAPEVLAADLDAGLVLLEDLGDDLFVRAAAARPDSEAALYEAAVDLLAELAGHEAPDAAEGSGAHWPLGRYDGAELAREARLVPEWYLPGATGRPVSEPMAAEYEGLLAEVARAVGRAADVVVLRDYHAENLVWLPGRPGSARVGLLDYQDALAGHAAYDLMSLLEDARRDTSETLREAMIARYLARRPGLDRERFRADYAALGAIRNLKIIGIFARLSQRDGKPRYVEFMPRVWDHLMRDLVHPALAPLAEWAADWLPPPDARVRARIAALASAGAA